MLSYVILIAKSFDSAYPGGSPALKFLKVGMLQHMIEVKSALQRGEWFVRREVNSQSAISSRWLRILNSCLCSKQAYWKKHGFSLSQCLVCRYTTSAVQKRKKCIPWYANRYLIMVKDNLGIVHVSTYHARSHQERSVRQLARASYQCLTVGALP